MIDIIPGSHLSLAPEIIPSGQMHATMGEGFLSSTTHCRFPWQGLLTMQGLTHCWLSHVNPGLQSLSVRHPVSIACAVVWGDQSLDIKQWVNLLQVTKCLTLQTTVDISISLERRRTEARFPVIPCLTNGICCATWLSLTNVIAFLDREVTLLIGVTILVPCTFNCTALDYGVALKPRWTDTVRLVVIHFTNCSVTTGSGQARVNTFLWHTGLVQRTVIIARALI